MKQIEQENQDALRIASEQIVAEHYFTAEQGVRQAYTDNGDVHVGSTPNDLSATALPLLTFCVLVLKDGSTVTGETSRDSVIGFDVDFERALARQNAQNKLLDGAVFVGGLKSDGEIEPLNEA